MNLKEIKTLVAKRAIEELENPDKYKPTIKLLMEGYRNKEISYEEIEPYLDEIGKEYQKTALEVLGIVDENLGLGWKKS
ncbi:uncharacterized protein YfbU (UPF0304 family) [Chryseobacterium rhizosphaerae]|uniref:hypothetical protein n=1 Tax=Chryseobacterium rhizosphaerae TaxID=395937 RepID=UPI00285DE257|nr:hypothetical protein [Chryseobacterium rhizosphaerae]MDR6548524.1 uncharacterized protein YfbU (UPF0304 family) [Chryseobacterium rhizosphaerae]